MTRENTASMGRSSYGSANSASHVNGYTAQSPLMDLFGVVVYGGAWLIFSLLQISATATAVFGLLQLGIHVTPGMTGQQALAFINGSLDRNHTVANAIAWGVQLALFAVAFPSDRSFLLAHMQNNTVNSESITRNAENLAKASTFVIGILILGDVVTDFLYAAAGHNLIGGTVLGFIPSIADGGGLIVAVIYPIAILSVTVFCGPRAFHRLGSFLHAIGRRH